MKTLDHVAEFANIDSLNTFLNRNNESQQFIIQKVFKAADKTYFIWYTEDK